MDDLEPGTLADALEEELDAEPLPRPPPRRKRDRADKSPSKLGRAGLKNFIPSARDADKVRPTLDDVERISRGQRAKQRGVGSRATPHRLNADERAAFERAKQSGFLVLKGRGYRKERKGSPLLNIFRQLCDARGRAAVWVELGSGGPGAAAASDVCAVDIAPLRLAEDGAAARAIAEAVRAAGPLLPAGERPETVAPEELPTIEQLRTQPIWNVPFHEVRFLAADRPAAKEMASVVSKALDDWAACEASKQAVGSGVGES